MEIKKAVIKDTQELTELTMRSKSYWGYSQQQMQAWEGDLTVSENEITHEEVYKLVHEEKIIGYYSFYKKNDAELKLERVFVDPQFIRCGLGKRLIIDFFKRVEKTKFERIIVDADPNAEKFYSRLGFKVVGKLESSIENRYLPIMEMKKVMLKEYVNKL